MKKIFILGASSKLARKFILSNKTKKNLSFFFTYNKSDIKDLSNVYPDAKSCKIDLTKKIDLEKVSKKVLRFRPDIIINYSSIITKRQSIKKFNNSYLFKIFNLNFFSQFILYSKICQKLNQSNQRSLIINISSKVILNGGFKMYEYSCSKAATANLIKSLSREYQNLRFINLIIPNVGNRTKKNQIDYNRYVDSLSKIIKVKYKFYRSKNQKIDYII